MVILKFIVTILTFSILIAGCNFGASTLNCNQIEEIILQGEQVMSTDLDSIHAQILNIYSLQRENIQIYEYPSEKISTLVTWQHEGNEYMASFEQERLRRILVRLQPNTVNFGTILDCLPEPTYYYFTFGQDVEAWRHDLDLWYPELRLIVSTVKFQNTPGPLTPDEGLTVTDVIWVPDSSVEMMARDLYPHADDDQISETLLLLREWPGSLSRLEPVHAPE